MTPSRSNRADVVVVGGGLVGATAALALARAGLSVAVLEAESIDEKIWPENSFDLRVSALSLATQRMFTALGVWPDMVEMGVAPFRAMRVWDSAGGGRIEFDASELAEPALGHIVENRVTRRALLRALQQCANVQLEAPSAVTGLRIEDDAAYVETSRGTTWRAQLVVGADGNRSKVRQLLRIDARGWSYDQRAVVATVKTALPHQDTAWQRFLPAGPLAFLPLRDNHCSIVWSTFPSHAEQLLALDDATFNRQLTDAFEATLGEVSVVGARGAFPLKLEHVPDYVRPRIALIGDAAHTVHPLAGQGANLGFLDAAALAQIVGEGAASGVDAGDLRLLRRYERWRKGDNLLMLGVMDGFKRVFGSASAPLRIARNTGFNAVNRTPFLKEIFIRRAMGLSGDLPKLCSALPEVADPSWERFPTAN